MNKDESAYMGLDDLKCGQNIELYARVYHIVACDEFPRWYFLQNGIEVGEEVRIFTFTKRKLPLVVIEISSNFFVYRSLLHHFFNFMFFIL